MTTSRRSIHHNTPLDYLREAYFNKLEADCIDFTQIEDLGNGYSESQVKDEYLNTSIEQMCEYLELSPEIEFIVTIACKYWQSATTNQLEEQLFNTVYQWGRVGVVTDHTSPVFQSMVNALNTQGK